MNILLKFEVLNIFLPNLQDTMGWGENDRGVSFTFGAEVAAKFLHKHDFDLICRAHQVVEDGNYTFCICLYAQCSIHMYNLAIFYPKTNMCFIVYL